MAVSFLMHFQSFAQIQISQKKVSKQEKKKQNRVRDWRIVQHVNEQMASNITLVTLSSGESMAGYQISKVYTFHSILYIQGIVISLLSDTLPCVRIIHFRLLNQHSMLISNVVVSQIFYWYNQTIMMFTRYIRL